MGLDYVNRRGDRYFVLQGLTKTGKPKYYCARRTSATGIPIDRLPEGYEFHERPEDALVSVRKVRPSRVQSFERERLIQLATQFARVPVLIEIENDSLVIYASNTDPEASALTISMLLGLNREDARENRDWIVQNSKYSPMLRLTLIDEEERLFSVQRWCCRGSTDRWIHLFGSGKSLDDLAETYLQHLGRDSFFELM